MSDERACRLCYASGDADDDRLFRPCLCGGTQAYIHESCLEAWRQSAHNTSNYFQCPVCSYVYRLRRISVYHAITHWVLLLVLTPLLVVALLLAVAALLQTLRALLTEQDYGGEVVLLGVTDVSLCWAVAVVGLVAFVAAACTGEQLPRDMPTPYTCQGACFFMILIGLCFLAYWTFRELRAWLRRRLRQAGDQVLEIKKND